MLGGFFSFGGGGGFCGWARGGTGVGAVEEEGRRGGGSFVGFCGVGGGGVWVWLFALVGSEVYLWGAGWGWGGFLFGVCGWLGFSSGF